MRLDRPWVVVVSWPGLRSPLHLAYTWTRWGGQGLADDLVRRLKAEPDAREAFVKLGIPELIISVVRRG